MFKRKRCRISLPGLWLYLPYALLYRQLLLEMSQSVYCNIQIIASNSVIYNRGISSDILLVMSEDITWCSRPRTSRAFGSWCRRPGPCLASGSHSAWNQNFDVAVRSLTMPNVRQLLDSWDRIRTHEAPKLSRVCADLAVCTSTIGRGPEGMTRQTYNIDFPRAQRIGQGYIMERDILINTDTNCRGSYPAVLFIVISFTLLNKIGHQ